MSWVFLLSVVILLAAIALIELRAVRAGDERDHHAPGYAMVVAGLVLIGIGIAAAISQAAPIALLASMAGLCIVALGATRHREASTH